MVHEIRDWLFLFLLLYAGWSDIRARRISRTFLVITGCIGVLFCFLLRRTLVDLVPACGIGVVILGISWLTDEKIGKGDGWFFITAGLFLEWKEIFVLFWGGMLCSFVLSVAVLLQERLSMSGNMKPSQLRKKGLPFLALLLPAEIIWLVLR